jgi:hypothetical protein
MCHAQALGQQQLQLVAHKGNVSPTLLCPDFPTYPAPVF